MRISILGGTGKLGFGLAKRFADLDKEVIIGSRSKEKADRKAEEINKELNSSYVKGDNLINAASKGDIIFLTLPFTAQEETIKQLTEELTDKIVVDTTVPINPDSPTEQRDTLISVAEKTSSILNNVELVAGFHTVSHTILNNLSTEIEGDVLICGDDERALSTILSLIKELGAHPVHAGNLKNARVLERLTPMIIGMNKRYKKRHIGIKFTGL